MSVSSCQEEILNLGSTMLRRCSRNDDEYCTYDNPCLGNMYLSKAEFMNICCK